MESFSRWFQQVSDEGDVLYVFPKDYRSKLAAKSFKMKIEPFVDKAKVLSTFVPCRFTFSVRDMHIMAVFPNDDPNLILIIFSVGN